MKVTMYENEPTTFEFPVIMIATDGCIKLFINAREGVLLTLAGGGKGTRLDFGRTANACTPVTDSSYWKRYDGSITLSNDY